MCYHINMLCLKVFLFVCLAVALASPLEDVEVEDSDRPLVRTRRYITCDSTWSCEDCNTRKFCQEAWWTTYVVYYQCPTWSPYCRASATGVQCSTNGTVGCTG
ncbi:uncharacterized protein LOC124363835 [Homalodisca vitripennis]|uniref:uncharacterized protein LOC124363835 n=1 Tax=Homalodisca vitripennis TaxID=197043 RepID=UPI001EEBF582|nr:uncharacterized protein LOC124363835 [Homalodisca vitripennis]